MMWRAEHRREPRPTVGETVWAASGAHRFPCSVRAVLTPHADSLTWWHMIGAVEAEDGWYAVARDAFSLFNPPTAVTGRTLTAPPRAAWMEQHGATTVARSTAPRLTAEPVANEVVLVHGSAQGQWTARVLAAFPPYALGPELAEPYALLEWGTHVGDLVNLYPTALLRRPPTR